MKYLETRATGFVGTNLTKRLLEIKEEVILVGSLVRAGSEQPNQVFHFAAQVAVTSSIDNPLRDFRINAEGTFNVAKAAHEIGASLIYSSTNKVYGNNVNSVPIREESTRYDFSGDMKKKGNPRDIFH
jgi:CDP-paratose 2-epimerase